MIKLPKEVSRIMKTMEESGYQVYAVGGCVRDSLLGKSPIDFDLATNAGWEEITAVFPEAKVLSEKYSVVRLDYSDPQNEDKGIIVDLATFRVDGKYSDYRHPDTVYFTEEIREDLARRDFTINAMADNPLEALIDPYQGREDLKARLIRTVGDPKVRFCENPIRMLRAVRLAAQLDFDLHQSVYEAILECGHLLEKASKDAVRGEFEKIVTAENTGKGLQMLLSCNFMKYIVGEEAASRMSRYETGRLEGMIAGVDRTFRVLERRLGVFYSCFDKKRAEEAVAFLGYDKKTSEMLKDAIYLQEKVFFLIHDEELKDFLARSGRERYDYIHNLAKAVCIIYEQPNSKVQGRNYMMKRIDASGDPIYIEDLAITGQDLIDAGFAEGEKVGELLFMLTDVVHRKPEENTREALLDYARRFSRSKLSAALRNVKWVK